MSTPVALLDRRAIEPCRPGSDPFESIGCDVPHDNPDTPDVVQPDLRIRREFFGNGKLLLPNGDKVEMWGFEDPDSNVRRPFPSALIRVPEGKVVHHTVSIGKNSHTIHHHGIEPTPFNDGVGHTSFEVTGSYTYQWWAHQAGTYLYHCHKNTVLHFEMGMYGLLIVDAPSPEGVAGTYPPGGPGFVRRQDGIIPYQVEALWVADDIDPRWHKLEHSAGLCGEDVGLNDLKPTAFVISGVVANPRNPLILDRRVAVRARAGDTLLVRLANAAYGVVRATFHGLSPEVIASDGRTFDSQLSPYSQPFTVASGQSIILCVAERYDFLLRNLSPGSYRVTFEFLHWIRGTDAIRDADAFGIMTTPADIRTINAFRLGIAETEIVVSG